MQLCFMFFVYIVKITWVSREIVLLFSFVLKKTCESITAMKMIKGILWVDLEPHIFFYEVNNIYCNGSITF